MAVEPQTGTDRPGRRGTPLASCSSAISKSPNGWLYPGELQLRIAVGPGRGTRGFLWSRAAISAAAVVPSLGVAGGSPGDDEHAIVGAFWASSRGAPQQELAAAIAGVAPSWKAAPTSSVRFA
jgi:hypothetical protein